MRVIRPWKQAPRTGDEIVPMHPRWQAILRGDSPYAISQRAYRACMALIPAPWRCKFCNAPFSGPAAGTMRWIGHAPSRKNPGICAR